MCSSPIEKSGRGDECAPKCVSLLLKRGGGIELDLIIQIVYVSMQNGRSLFSCTGVGNLDRSNNVYILYSKVSRFVYRFVRDTYVKIVA